jgi:hypothetical protein
MQIKEGLSPNSLTITNSFLGSTIRNSEKDAIITL